MCVLDFVIELENDGVALAMDSSTVKTPIYMSSNMSSPKQQGVSRRNVCASACSAHVCEGISSDTGWCDSTRTRLYACIAARQRGYHHRPLGQPAAACDSTYADTSDICSSVSLANGGDFGP